jgi:hypothetical protein
MKKLIAVLALSLFAAGNADAGIFRNRCGGCRPIRNTVCYVSTTATNVGTTAVRTAGAVITAPVRIICNGGICNRD